MPTTTDEFLANENTFNKETVSPAILKSLRKKLVNRTWGNKPKGKRFKQYRNALRTLPSF